MNTDIYKINKIEELLNGNSYVGRGIVIGKTQDATKAVVAYFIMGRSENSRNRVFEEKMNISPKQYILQKKLALASKLISEGTPPTIVAMRLGYENYSNFYRLYLKYFGKNPAKKEKYWFLEEATCF